MAVSKMQVKYESTKTRFESRLKSKFWLEFSVSDDDWRNICVKRRHLASVN